MGQFDRQKPIVATVHGGVGVPAASEFRRLSNIYLDTTFAVKARPYREFPSRADGVAELLRKLMMYPADTVFYFHAWTFGYEEVWATLAQVLNSRIHLDPYRYSLYTSLKGSFSGSGLECRESALMSGFKLGNVEQPGLFTQDPNVRLHSCERGTGCCPVIEPPGEGQQVPDVVWIKPVVSRDNGVDIEEVGAGGGKGDLNQVHELDLADVTDVMQLQALCDAKITDVETRRRVSDVLERARSNQKQRISFPANGQVSGLKLDSLEEDEDGNIPLRHVVDILRNHATSEPPSTADNKPKHDATTPLTSKLSLPRTTTFPYSRHSSYAELRHLVETFRPRDVYPCTAPTPENFKESGSMSALFGDLVAGASVEMAWDGEMRGKVAEMRRRKREAGEFDTQQKEDEEEQDMVEAGVACESNNVESVTGAGSGARTDMKNYEIKPPETSPKTDHPNSQIHDPPQNPTTPTTSPQSFETAESWDPHSSLITQIPSSPPLRTSHSSSVQVTPRKRKSDVSVCGGVADPPRPSQHHASTESRRDLSPMDTNRHHIQNHHNHHDHHTQDVATSPKRPKPTPNPTPTPARTKSNQQRLAHREAAARAVRSGTWGAVIRLECLGVGFAGATGGGACSDVTATVREHGLRKGKRGMDTGALGSGKKEQGMARDVYRIDHEDGVKGVAVRKKMDRQRDGSVEGRGTADRRGGGIHNVEGVRLAYPNKPGYHHDEIQNRERRRNTKKEETASGAARPPRGKRKEIHRHEEEPSDRPAKNHEHAKVHEMEDIVVIEDDVAHSGPEDDEDDGWGPTSSWEVLDRGRGESLEL